MLKELFCGLLSIVRRSRKLRFCCESRVQRLQQVAISRQHLRPLLHQRVQPLPVVTQLAAKRFAPRDECPDAITNLGAPLPYPVGVNASAESVGGLLVYVNPPYWEESWRHGTRIHDACEWTSHTAGNYAGIGWVTTHEEEMAENGWPMGGRLWVMKLGGWTNPSPGLFRRTYERRRLGITEQSTLELRVVTP